MPTCRACGATASEDARFCPTCGTAFRAGAPAEGTRTTEFSIPGPWTPTPPGPSPFPQAPPAPMLPEARPTGVAILGVWSIIAGPLMALLGGGLMVAGPRILTDPAFQDAFRAQAGAELPNVDVGLVLVGFGFYLAVAGLGMAFAGYGTLQRRPWGWAAMVGVTLWWFLGGLVALLSGGLLTLVLAGFVLWYFTRDGVKRWFGKQPANDPGLPGYVPPPSPPPPTAP
jgi:hypothetical protein